MHSDNELDFAPGFSASDDALPAELLPAQEHSLELISHLADYSDMLVLVTGPDGSGKTLLARTLAERRHGNDDALLITATMMLGMPALLQQIAAHWQIRLPTDTAAAREMISREAQHRAEQGGSLLLLIDQADQLDTETLNDIAHLALLAPQALNIVLFGQPGLENALRGGPAQAQAQVQHLVPLSLAEAQQLLQRVYSPGQALPLSEKELAFIMQQSQGWPGPLLLQASDYFLTAQTDENMPPARQGSRASGGRFPLFHILAIAALVTALGLSLLYRESTEVEESTIAELPEPVDFLRGVTLPEGAAEMALDDEPVLADDPAAADMDDMPASIATTESDYNFPSPSPVSVPTVPAPVPVAVTAAPAKPVSAPAPAVSASPAPAVTAVPAITSSRSEDDRQRLLAVSSGFVVQLFGSYEAANADKFRRQWRDEIIGTLYLYETRHNNKPWFVVVAGVYGSRAEATAAVNALPRPLRDQSPWIRDISAVKQALR